MRIKPDLLESDLNRTLRAVYLLSGDEPLQLIEAADVIRRIAHEKGYTEREVFHVDKSFDWEVLLQAANSMSLFSEKKILDLRFSSVKLGDAGRKALSEYCERISPDNIMLLSMPKLDKRSQGLKWFKTLDQIGAIVQVWPVEGNQLIHWIVRRMQSRGLTVARDVAGLLAEKVEGNLLAAAQEIEKLSLNSPATISAADILEAAGDDAKYDVFKLIDAVLAGKYKRVTKILRGLELDGTAPSVVLWAFTREIRAMVAISHDVRQGIPLNTVFSKHRVWDNRAALVKSGLVRHKASQWLDLLNRAIKVDQMIKGLHDGNVWDELQSLGFSMSGKELLGNRA